MEGKRGGKGEDILGDGDKVGGVGHVEKTVIEVLVGAFGRVELAVINPNIGALLETGLGVLGSVPQEEWLGLSHVDGQGVAVGGDDRRGLDVADDDVLLLLDLQADTDEALGEGAVVSDGCLAWGAGGGSAQGK